MSERPKPISTEEIKPKIRSVTGPVLEPEQPNPSMVELKELKPQIRKVEEE